MYQEPPRTTRKRLSLHSVVQPDPFPGMPIFVAGAEVSDLIGRPLEELSWRTHACGWHSPALSGTFRRPQRQD